MQECTGCLAKTAIVDRLLEQKQTEDRFALTFTGLTADRVRQLVNAGPGLEDKLTTDMKLMSSLEAASGNDSDLKSICKECIIQLGQHLVKTEAMLVDWAVHKAMLMAFENREQSVKRLIQQVVADSCMSVAFPESWL